jgi:hypothetical protein
VRLRAAQTVLGVAHGEDERLWVARAETMTVRALEELVRRGGACADDDEPWHALRAGLDEEERATVDEALDLAGELMPGSSRVERVEAIAQEFFATCPADPDLPDAEHLREFPAALRRIDAGEPSRDRAREAALETSRRTRSRSARSTTSAASTAGTCGSWAARRSCAGSSEASSGGGRGHDPRAHGR